MAKKDYAAKQKEKIQQATEKLEQGILDFLSGDQYQDYLKVMSKFHNYSYSNSILIAMQRPDATYLAGYTGWQKKFKRQVLPGEHGIKIFAPAPIKQVVEKERLDPDTNLPVLDENGDPVKDTVEVKIPKFKVVTVFDVAQTSGEPLPELEIPDLTGNVAEYEAFLEAIRRTADVPVSFEPIEGESHGYFSPSEQRIAIREGMSEAQTLKTAIHELAHSRLHNIEQDSGKPALERKDRNTKEVEAESIAEDVLTGFTPEIVQMITEEQQLAPHLTNLLQDEETHRCQTSELTAKNPAAEPGNQPETPAEKNYLKAAEEYQEENYNCIDGIMFTQNKLTPGDDTLSQPEKIPDKSAEKERPSVIGRLKAAQEKLAEKTDTTRTPNKSDLSLD